MLQSKEDVPTENNARLCDATIGWQEQILRFTRQPGSPLTGNTVSVHLPM